MSTGLKLAVKRFEDYKNSGKHYSFDPLTKMKRHVYEPPFSVSENDIDSEKFYQEFKKTEKKRVPKYDYTRPYRLYCNKLPIDMIEEEIL